MECSDLRSEPDVVGRFRSTKESTETIITDIPIGAFHGPRILVEIKIALDVESGNAARDERWRGIRITESIGNPTPSSGNLTVIPPMAA
jgi:hypothetical protein